VAFVPFDQFQDLRARSTANQKEELTQLILKDEIYFENRDCFNCDLFWQILKNVSLCFSTNSEISLRPSESHRQSERSFSTFIPNWQDEPGGSMHQPSSRPKRFAARAKAFVQALSFDFYRVLYALRVAVASAALLGRGMQPTCPERSMALCPL
jgi:hypothetical protein